MGKKIAIIAGLLAMATGFGGRLLARVHSPLADFVRLLCFPVCTTVFLLALFLTRTRRSGFNQTTGILFRYTRIAVLLGIAFFLIAVFWPRSYGTPPVAMRPGTRYWNLPTGSRIAYTLIPAKGIRKPYPIICLHGGPGGGFGDGSIRVLTPLAADGYDIYLYDQVGGGLSARLTDIRAYTPERHKRDLEAIVQKIGASKVILMGHSWGAILAVLYTADNPDRVDRLIVTGPGSIVPIRPGLASERAPDSLHLKQPYYTNQQGNEQAANIRSKTMAFFATQFGWKIASDREADDFAGYLTGLTERSTYADTSKIGPVRPVPGAGYYCAVMTMLSQSRTPDPRPRLRNNRIPLLEIRGQYDNQPWGYAQEYLDLFPDHRLVILANAGHSISAEQPAAFLSAVTDFLGKRR
ncbi:MAG TPA: alpha/beta hydrolase [Puia sp.]|nr:alpha/beta hydrolase [Puia sp.]